VTPDRVERRRWPRPERSALSGPARNLLLAIPAAIVLEGDRIVATLQNVVDILAATAADEQRLAADVQTLLASVASLQEQIANLQASAGLSPEDQALVDQIAASAQAIDDGINTLDAQVAPAAPAAPADVPAPDAGAPAADAPAPEPTPAPSQATFP